MTATEVSYESPGKPPLAIAQGELLGTLTAGQTLSIERVTLEQGSVRYWGSGAVGLDPSNRPSGKLDTQTNDLDGLLKIIEPHLELTNDQIAGLKAILSLLGSSGKAPLTAKDGVLYLGPFKLTDLPPLY